MSNKMFRFIEEIVSLNTTTQNLPNEHKNEFVWHYLHSPKASNI